MIQSLDSQYPLILIPQMIYEVRSALPPIPTPPIEPPLPRPVPIEPPLLRSAPIEPSLPRPVPIEPLFPGALPQRLPIFIFWTFLILFSLSLVLLFFTSISDLILIPFAIIPAIILSSVLIWNYRIYPYFKFQHNRKIRLHNEYLTQQRIRKRELEAYQKYQNDLITYQRELEAYQKYQNDLIAYQREIKAYQKYQNDLIAYQRELEAARTPERVKAFRNQRLLEVLRNTTSYDDNNGHALIGRSEETFRLYLIQYFSDKIHVQLKVQPPWFSSDFYYTPDFAYIDTATNLHIDVEIDEPYAMDGRPLHFIGLQSEVNRNRYFIDILWIVIRFAEEQVVRYPDSCCKKIASLISNITNNHLILNQFIRVPDLQLMSRWTEEESVQMYLQRHRNTYLP
ncbi:hypothetical protein [Cylindrospermopsis curvispora]|uniref:Uncharacterized protein n=1 Tax=Cylindrospermopsis curvispora GIHE-G1 TaxID=2666332 RepID=A0A7H0F5N8_9CYAN|nr:hypothetical protein [Cylindrospermopsis curvispora]QNP31354.1 hypothetical protein IAR63_17905 [Cylindrospermopsis curvispora GIHE-G1]